MTTLASAIREVLRLKYTTPMSARGLGDLFGMPHNTVGAHILRAKSAGIVGIEDLDSLDDDELKARLFKPRKGMSMKREPDFAELRAQLDADPAMTVERAWTKYAEADPETAYSESTYRKKFKKWCRLLKVVMRQHHEPGAELFGDYCGDTAEWQDPETGEIHVMQVWVSVLGYSQLFHVYAVPSQSTEDTIEALIRGLEYFKGVSKLFTPDNLKAVVTRAGRHPRLNRVALDCARHYGYWIHPARVRRGPDKSLAEVHVQITQRDVLLPLRDRVFFSPEELNAAIMEKVEAINNRPHTKFEGSRRERFEKSERQALRSLPATRFEIPVWTGEQKIQNDHMFVFERHRYSVPHQLIGKKLRARVTATTVQIFYGEKSIALHTRSRDAGGFTEVLDHMPEDHRSYATRNREYHLEWARKVGPHALKVIEHQFTSRPHPRPAVVVCGSLERVCEQHGKERFEAACRRALELGNPTSSRLESILKHRLEERPDLKEHSQIALPLNPNVRGPEHYRNTTKES